MADVPAELHDEIVSIGINSSKIARLARSYRSALLGSLRPNESERFRAGDGHFSNSLIPPALAWSACQKYDGPSKPHVLWDGLNKAESEYGVLSLEHITAPAGHSLGWCVGGVSALAADVAMTTQGNAPVLAESAEGAKHRIVQAVDLLRDVWPEAALELNILVRAIVYLDGGSFRSATLLDTYGAVYVGVDYIASVPAAFETLLHEGGHHSLYLRNIFTSFVLNGTESVSHPLRPDERPLSGTVHACHVLARIAWGLSRLAESKPGSTEVLNRRDRALTNLSATIEILGEHARWTVAGRDYFRGVVELSESLAAGRLT